MEKTWVFRISAKERINDMYPAECHRNQVSFSRGTIFCSAFYGFASPTAPTPG
jgi:hypothetical protein